MVIIQTFGILWQYCRNELALNDDGAIADFTATTAVTDSFKITKKITGQTGNNGPKDVEIIVPLKYLSNFWRALEMSLINCEINLDLNWSKKCVIVANSASQATTISMTDTKPYVSVVTLSTQDNVKLLEELKFRF